MQIKRISEANITDAVIYLNTHISPIEEGFLLAKIRSGEFFAYGCYDENTLLGLFLLTNKGHIICLHISAPWKGRGLEKLLFGEIYQICTNQLRLSRITANVPRQDVSLYSYLGFRISESEPPAPHAAFVPMQFFVYPGDIKPASNHKGLIIGLSIAGGFVLLIMVFIASFFIIFSFTAASQKDPYDYLDDTWDAPESWDDSDDSDYPDWYHDDSGEGSNDSDDNTYSYYDDIYSYYGDNYSYYEDPYSYYDDDYEGYRHVEEESTEVPNPYIAVSVSYEIEESSFVDYYHDDETYVDFEVIYPQIKGSGSGHEGEINLLIKSYAMETTEELYLRPSEDTKELLAESDYLYLSSLVTYEIAYMDDNFISIVLKDHYFWGSIFGEFYDMNTLNINLKDGTFYEISDFINVNKDFTDLWVETLLKEEPDNIPLLNLDSALFTEMLLTGDWIEGRYNTNFFVSGDGIHMALTYHYNDGNILTRGWATAPFPANDLTPHTRECELWNLISPVLK